MNLKNIKIRLWEWGHTISGENYMQITVPINGRIQSEAQADFIAKYVYRYEFVRIFKMTETTFGIHFKKLSVVPKQKEGE